VGAQITNTPNKIGKKGERELKIGIKIAPIAIRAIL
jgi:hypothetical protein